MSSKNKYGIVYADVIRDPALSLRAKGIYSILATYADKNRKCFPSVATIAEFAGVSKRTAERCLAELVDKGYVKRHKRHFIIS